MILNNILLFINYMYIILFLLIIFFIVIILKKKDFFTVISEIKGNIYPVNERSSFDFFNNKVYIGKYDDNEMISQYNYSKANIGSFPVNVKNTLYVKDNIKIGNSPPLTISALRKIKNSPYLFDDEICLSDDRMFITTASTDSQSAIDATRPAAASTMKISCIKPEHIDVINGNRAMIINSFPRLYPFVFYTEKNYSGWKMPSANLDIINNSSCSSCEPGKKLYYKSVKIQPGFKLNIFSQENGPIGGSDDPDSPQNYITIDKDTPDFEAIGGEAYAEGIKSYYPETTFGQKDNIGDRLCLTSYRFGPWQQRIDGTSNIFSNIITAKPCSFKKDQEFRINKKKLYYDNQDSDVKIHRHHLDQVHGDIN